jgi:2-methylcitrate dehydratase PrpD
LRTVIGSRIRQDLRSPPDAGLHRLRTRSGKATLRGKVFSRDHFQNESVHVQTQAPLEAASNTVATADTLATADTVHQPGSCVIGHGQCLGARDAASMNGVILHGLDFDDTHTGGIVHLSVSVLPAVLAVGSRIGSSGEDLLIAYCLGLEAGARLAQAGQGGFHAQGFHPTGMIGAFASCLAVGRLMGLTSKQLVQAQGIVLSLASGSLQFLEDGAWTKRLHPGWAAQAGITAATMACHGVVGPSAPYAGRFGLYQCFLDEAGRAKAASAIQTLSESLHFDAGTSLSKHTSKHWELVEIAIKPFPMCHFVHAAIDAAIVMHRRGVSADQIASIEVFVPEQAVSIVCEPEPKKRLPQNDYDAKFSVHYAVACGLIRGRLGLKDLERPALEDLETLSLMQRITYRRDPKSGFPKYYSAELRLRLKNGQEIQHREAINRGHADRPLSAENIIDKFVGNARLNFSQRHGEALKEMILSMDHQVNLKSFERLLATPAHQGSTDEVSA